MTTTSSEAEPFGPLSSEMVSRIVEALGKTGESFACDVTVPTDSFFVSSISMMKLTFPSGEERRLVVKDQPEDPAVRTTLKTDVLFRNEITFYENFGRSCSAYPKCLLTIPGRAIVMEDVRELGYEVRPSTEELGVRHALAAVREIGRFHARGYLLKEKKGEDFLRLVEGLGDPRLGEDVDPVMVRYVNELSKRPIRYLESVDYDPPFCERMMKHLENAHEAILRDCARPRNELAVLCHGDFTANNVLFREGEDGLEAKLIDFALIRYSSPATDLSTFLYLSCSREVRERFDEVFQAYHGAVLEHLEEEGVGELGKYSFKAFLEDYKRHAFYGCVMGMFFVPVMRSGKRMDQGAVDHQSEYIEEIMLCGGDELSKNIADMLLEMRSSGCLDYLM